MKVFEVAGILGLRTIKGYQHDVLRAGTCPEFVVDWHESSSSLGRQSFSGDLWLRIGVDPAVVAELRCATLRGRHSVIGT